MQFDFETMIANMSINEANYEQIKNCNSFFVNIQSEVAIMKGKVSKIVNNLNTAGGRYKAMQKQI